MKVAVAVHEYKDGTSMHVAESKEALDASLAGLIRRFWWADLEEQFEDNEEDVPEQPKDDAKLVELYFEIMGEQFEAEWLMFDMLDVMTLDMVRERDEGKEKVSK